MLLPTTETRQKFNAIHSYIIHLRRGAFVDMIKDQNSPQSRTLELIERLFMKGMFLDLKPLFSSRDPVVDYQDKELRLKILKFFTAVAIIDSLMDKKNPDEKAIERCIHAQDYAHECYL